MSFTFGKRFRVTVSGESHGRSIGAVVDGCPPGVRIDIHDIQKELDRRRPGLGELTSPRNEMDRVEMSGGVKDGLSTGKPIRLDVRNEDVDSADYDRLRDMPRPGHADFTARMKFGSAHSHRGGGIFSGRMTVPFVMAGSIAKSILSMEGIKVLAHVIQIGGVEASNGISDGDVEKNTYETAVRCADLDAAGGMEREIRKAMSDGDSVGGLVECRIAGVPAGVGEPLFDSIESVLSHLIFSIPGVKGIEFGSGFGCVRMRGSGHNDPFIMKGGDIMTETNNAGGILGGISNSMPILFRVAFKPTPSISKSQRTVDLSKMKEAEIEIMGRHDPCIAIRATPVVEAMAAIGMAELLMRRNHDGAIVEHG